MPRELAGSCGVNSKLRDIVNPDASPNPFVPIVPDASPNPFVPIVEPPEPVLEPPLDLPCDEDAVDRTELFIRTSWS